MSSESKKRKAKNSYLHNGGEKLYSAVYHLKKIFYFTKKERKALNSLAKED